MYLPSLCLSLSLYDFYVPSPQVSVADIAFAFQYIICRSYGCARHTDCLDMQQTCIDNSLANYPSQFFAKISDMYGDGNVFNRILDIET